LKDDDYEFRKDNEVIVVNLPTSKSLSTVQQSSHIATCTKTDWSRLNRQKKAFKYNLCPIFLRGADWGTG